MSIKYGPVRKIPFELRSRYTLGIIPVLDWYIDDSIPRVTEWPVKLVNEFCKRFTSEKIYKHKHGYEPYPGAAKLHCMAFDKYPIRGKDVAVIGSITPWIECLALNYGCKSVTTVEYNVPNCKSDRIKTISFNEFLETSNKYGVVITFSSIEHSGLGRYGDPLDPDGDVRAMYAIRQNLKDDGLLYWGAPVGRDALVWNAHRVYGNIRLPLIFKGFEEMEWFGCDKKGTLNRPLATNGFQPVIVLKKA